MEPVQIGRGDPVDTAVSKHRVPAAMEPVQIGRGDALSVAMGDLGSTSPQWEPVQIGRGDVCPLREVNLIPVPQWSPSRSDGVTISIPVQLIWAIQPQWSPSRSDGVTRPERRSPPARTCRRNGARPDRTG